MVNKLITRLNEMQVEGKASYEEFVTSYGVLRLFCLGGVATPIAEGNPVAVSTLYLKNVASLFINHPEMISQVISDLHDLSSWMRDVTVTMSNRNSNTLEIYSVADDVWFKVSVTVESKEVRSKQQIKQLVRTLVRQRFTTKDILLSLNITEQQFTEALLEK